MSMGIGIGCGIALLLAVIGLVLAAHSHRRWVMAQSPAGVWKGIGTDGTSIVMAFDGGPREGVYRELRARDAVSMREMGHWAVSGNELRLLIMATDVPDHPRFGQDTLYRISYTGPEEILLDGPDRPSLTLQKAPPGTEVPIEPSQSEA